MILEFLDVVMLVFHPSWRRHFGVRPGSHASRLYLQNMDFFKGIPLVSLISED